MTRDVADDPKALIVHIGAPTDEPRVEVAHCPKCSLLFPAVDLDFHIACCGGGA